MISTSRALQLSRWREVQTSAGQNAMGFLILKVLHPLAWVGLLGAVAAGIFAFSYNTIMDFQIGQTVEGKGKAIGPLRAEDIALCRIYCWTGLVGTLLCAWVLVHWTGRAGGAIFLLLYLLLGYLYSSPIFRWKEIPVLECACNGLAHSLPFLSGYVQFHHIDGLALFYSFSFFFFMCGYYLLHCLEDRHADKAAGIRNLCFFLGFSRTVGVALGTTIIGALFWFQAGMRAPILMIFLPFFLVALLYEIAVLRTRDIIIVSRIRLWGRFYGLGLFAILFLRAVY